MKHLLIIAFLSVTFLPSGRAQHPKKVKVKHTHVKFPRPIFEFEPFPIATDSIRKHLYEVVIITDKVYGLKVLDKHTLLYLGASYPHQRLTVILKDQETRRLAKSIKGKTVSVTGKLFTDNNLDDGKPIMYISSPYLINVQTNLANSL